MEEMDCTEEPSIDQKEYVKQFVKETKTSNEFARDFLMNYHWNIEQAIQSYSKNDENNPDNIKNLKFKLLSWNLDGLDEEDLTKRTILVIQTIKETAAVIVFLQEVVSLSQNLIEKHLDSSFQCFFKGDANYYCGILVRRDVNIFLTSPIQVVQYPRTKMGRSLLSLRVSIKGRPMLLMTTHLESMNANSAVRMEQLQCVFEKMVDSKEVVAVIAGGDLNIRDWEITKMGGLPSNITDVASSLQNTSFTWEPRRNTNITYELRHVSGLRFDRILMFQRPEPGPQLEPVEFSLIGDKIQTVDCKFASDHWGILTEFQIV